MAYIVNSMFQTGLNIKNIVIYNINKNQLQK